MLAAPGAMAGATLPRELPPHASRMDQVARRAHEIYEGRGGTHGKALEDWLQAEREIDDAMGAAAER